MDLGVEEEEGRDLKGLRWNSRRKRDGKEKMEEEERVMGDGVGGGGDKCEREIT